MNQEKFGQFIRDLRLKNNMTQKEFADKYNVTYQAVSKWETGKNMPDITLIKEISKDFNVSLEELFQGEYKENKKSKKILIIIGLLLIVIVLGLIIWFLVKDKSDFAFKTLSSGCDNFNISGNIAYNDKKSSIYITNIQYCGGNDTSDYKDIECTLYEGDEDTQKIISSYKYNKNKTIKLEDFLQKVTLAVDDYKKSCKDYHDNTLYLMINATDNDNKITTYKIPLDLNDSCGVN